MIYTIGKRGKHKYRVFEKLPRKNKKSTSFIVVADSIESAKKKYLREFSSRYTGKRKSIKISFEKLL